MNETIRWANQEFARCPWRLDSFIPIHDAIETLITITFVIQRKGVLLQTSGMPNRFRYELTNDDARRSPLLRRLNRLGSSSA